MGKKTFYEVLASNEYNPGEIQKLPFRMDLTGPLYEVTLGTQYSNPMDAIKNNDFKLKSNNKEITSRGLKLSILARLVYNHKSF
jgi:hypothetical protein